MKRVLLGVSVVVLGLSLAPWSLLAMWGGDDQGDPYEAHADQPVSSKEGPEMLRHHLDIVEALQNQVAHQERELEAVQEERDLLVSDHLLAGEEKEVFQKLLDRMNTENARLFEENQKLKRERDDTNLYYNHFRQMQLALVKAYLEINSYKKELDRVKAQLNDLMGKGSGSSDSVQTHGDDVEPAQQKWVAVPHEEHALSSDPAAHRDKRAQESMRIKKEIARLKRERDTLSNASG